MLHRADQERTGCRSRSLYLWLIFITLLLLVLDESGVLTPLKGQALRTLMPLQYGLTIARKNTHSLWDSLSGTSELRHEVEELRQKASKLEAEVLRLKAVQAENQRLRESLKIREQFAWHNVVASVLSISADPERRTMLINRGSVDGLALGMAVIGQEGSSPPAMVGVIDEIYSHSARVLLITDYSSVISAKVLHTEDSSDGDGSENVTDWLGELQGRWQVGRWLLLQKIDRDAQIAEGDPVVTAGLSQKLNVETPLAQIPANVPIGTIQDIRRSIGRTQEADVRPYLNPDRVQDVWVIVGND